MAPQTTLARGTSSVEGTYDEDRIERFTFPPSINFNRLVTAVSPMHALLSHGHRVERSQCDQHIINSTQNPRRQSEIYMDSANLRAKGDDRGFSMNNMTPPDHPSVDTAHYGRDDGKNVDFTNIRHSSSQHGRHNGEQSINRDSSPQRFDTNVSQHERHKSKIMLSPSRLPISTTSPNLSQLATHVSRLSHSRSIHSHHSIMTLNFHSRIHGHRLRRSVNSVDLRSYVTTNNSTMSNDNNQGSTSKGSDGGIEIPLTSSVPGTYYPSGSSSNITYGPSAYERCNEEEIKDNRKKVEKWRLTARTGNGEWPRSPLTPRPFTAQELGGQTSYHGAARDLLYVRAYKDIDPNEVSSEDDRDDETPRPPITSRQQNSLRAINSIQDRTNDWLPAGQEEEDIGTSFVALATMHRAQEQVRLGVDLPPLRPVDAYKIDRTRIGSVQAVASEKLAESGAKESQVVLELSPPSKIRKQGDPVKKPSPLKLQSAVTEKLAVRDDLPPQSDPQTYTTNGLTQVLYKLYTPSHLPSDVLAALPSSQQLTALSNPTTPAGATAFARNYHSPNLPTELSSKERNYVTYYIDTLLQRNESLVNEVTKLEEDVEDGEVSKADLQSQINKWFFDARESKFRIQTLETFIEDLVQNVVPGDKKQEARDVAMGLGVEIGYVGGAPQAGTAGGDDVGVDTGTIVEENTGEVARRQMRLAEEAKYWKARAEAAERFMGAFE